MEHLSPTVVFYVGPLAVTNTVVMTWVVMAIAIALAYYLGRNLSSLPSRRQVVSELVVEFLSGAISEGIGPKGLNYLPWIGSFFLFILMSNWWGVVPLMKAPTSDLATTATLAVLAIIGVWVIGVKENGLRGFLHHFVEPSIILLPINILEQFTRPLTLAIRLFGNVWGEEILAGVIFMIAKPIAPVPIKILDLFTGFMQAYVFTLLLISYVSGMLHHE